MSLLPMPGNRIQEIRECYQQAADCVQAQSRHRHRVDECPLSGGKADIEI
jgi:hypothetical protein